MGSHLGNKTWLVVALLSLVVFIVYFFTSPGHTPYNHFTLLADSFLKGKLYVEGVYPWLEKVPIDEYRFYVTNPPMPAIIALPFVYFFGKEFPQEYLAQMMGMGIVGLTMILSLKLTKNLKISIWSGMLIGLGSIVWFLSSVGSIWYIGQVASVFFITWALVEIKGKSRPILIGALLGASFLSRSHMALTFPFIIFLNWDKFKKVDVFIKLMIGFIPFAAFGFTYNYLRFGNILDNGYNYIPDVDTSPWFPKGIWHPSYIPKNLKILFLEMPRFKNEFPYIFPSWGGMAIWLTSPAFLFSFFAPLKRLDSKLMWINILITSFIVTSHGGTGFSQFGYRFAVDFYPFLTYLTILGISERGGLKKIHWLLLIFSIIVNLWGVLWINKFNWVTW